MAHFAELYPNNVVLRVLVVGNDKITDDSGQEQEALGVTFLQNLFGADTRWAQTSYNANFRGKYACIGDSYDAGRDAFIPPQPYPSWVLNEAACQWEAPIPYPEDELLYRWDENVGDWVVIVADQ